MLCNIMDSPSIQMSLSDGDSIGSLSPMSASLSNSPSQSSYDSSPSMLISTSGNVYELGKMLHKTRLGGVYHAIGLQLSGRPSSQPVVIKIYDKAKLTAPSSSAKYHENPLNEMMMLTLLSQYDPNRHIISVIEVFSDELYYYMVMPYCQGGDVMDLLECHHMRGISPEEARKVLKHVVLGVNHLHEKGIAHRDLSVENVVYNPADDAYMVIDLGLSIHVPSIHGDGQNAHVANTSVCGKKNYIAPEVWAQHPTIDPFRGDVWALGVMLFMLLTGCAPMHSSKSTDAHFDLICRHGRLADVFEASCRHAQRSAATDYSLALDLIQRMLTADPAYRIGLKEILAHPWMCV